MSFYVKDHREKSQRFKYQQKRCIISHLPFLGINNLVFRIRFSYFILLSEQLNPYLIFLQLRLSLKHFLVLSLYDKYYFYEDIAVLRQLHKCILPPFVLKSLSFNINWKDHTLRILKLSKFVYYLKSKYKVLLYLDDLILNVLIILFECISPYYGLKCIFYSLLSKLQSFMCASQLHNTHVQIFHILIFCL